MLPGHVLYQATLSFIMLTHCNYHSLYPAFCNSWWSAYHSLYTTTIVYYLFPVSCHISTLLYQESWNIESVLNRSSSRALLYLPLEFCPFGIVIDPYGLSMASTLFQPPVFQVWVLDGWDGGFSSLRLRGRRQLDGRWFMVGHDALEEEKKKEILAIFFAFSG